jgi:excisionase family DNA binding protein
MLNLGRSTLYQYLLKGEIRSVKVGRRRLIPRDAVHEFVEKLQQESRQGETW